jgi:surface antigen
MKKLTKCFAISFLIAFSVTALAEDSCKGYPSTGNPFACGTYGNCTWWAAYKRPDVQGKIGGNAGTWYQSAINNGFDVGPDPKVDSIAVFSGHVAYVESKNSDGSFYVSEMDYSGLMGSGKINATYHPYSGKRYTREDSSGKMGEAGSWNLTGFIYRKPYGANSTCTHLNGIYTVCWTPSSSDVSCKGGSDWVLYESDTGSMIRLSNSDYCPDYSSNNGGGSESSGPMPVTGGTNSGTLPNLIPNNSDIENASKTKVTTLHINEPGFCRMQTKNIGNKDAGAFQSKCFISDGYKIDNNPRDEGKEDTKGLAKGATHTEHEDFTAPEFPGVYNAVWCTNSAKQVTESNEGDNCHDEDVFTVWANSNVITSAINIIGGKSVFLPSETFSVDTTIINNGENFGKTILIGYYIDNALVGSDRIKRENLKGGVSKVENLDVATAPTTGGTHTLRVCADFDNRVLETNESDNCKSMQFEVYVASPTPPPPPPPADDGSSGSSSYVPSTTTLPPLTDAEEEDEMNAINIILNGI